MQAGGVESLWTEDLSQLWNGRPMRLWYHRDATDVQNTNALARFVILWTVVALFASRGHAASLALGAVLLMLVSSVPSNRRHGSGAFDRDHFLNGNTATLLQFCQLPSKDNPAANPMPSDYGTGEPKMPACPPGMVAKLMDQAIDNVGYAPSSPESMHAFRRTIYSLPSTTVPPDREAFMHTIYGNVSRRLDAEAWGGPIEALPPRV